ncbi:MAG: hypothetical protein D6741_10655 [Planctomycetota bacterium]|nr:MAG: hypothetical protein D6741_10655 [Planctomycetota bacterium]
MSAHGEAPNCVYFTERSGKLVGRATGPFGCISAGFSAKRCVLRLFQKTARLLPQRAADLANGLT